MNSRPSTYDFIVVGAGAAGSVLAWQLSTRLQRTVLVLEQGFRSNHRLIRSPVTYPHLFRDARFCQLKTTVPQTDLAGRRIPLPTGQGLGGSTLINAMIWVPPSRLDLQRWTSQTAGQWTEEEMRLALSEVTRTYDRFSQHAAELDQSLPPVHVSPSVQAVLRLANADNAGTAASYKRSTFGGRRTTAWEAFRQHPPNGRLHVETGTTVLKIEHAGERASGVVFRRRSQSGSETVLPTQGVILCAGALESPSLLHRSGIGHAQMLREAGIRPWIELPAVGENLQDHLVFPIINAWNEAPFPSRFGKTELLDWKQTGKGPISSNIAEAGAFLFRGPDRSFKLNASNCRHSICHESALAPAKTFLPNALADADGLGTVNLQGDDCEAQWHITPTHYLEYPLRDEPTAALSIGVTPLHPKSRGRVWLDFQSNALVDPNYLRERTDRDQLIDAVQWTRQWIQNTLRTDDCPIGKELLPGAKRADDEQVAAAVARFATTLYHYAGTCRAGEDSESVCDTDFQVRGCDNLWVCDASSLPSLPSGNTQVTVMMLAQMLTNRILGKG